MRRMSALITAFLILFFSTQIYCIDLVVRGTPQALIPVGDFAASNFTFGFGVNLNGDIVLSDVFFFGPEAGYLYQPISGTPELSWSYSGGLAAGVYWNPLPRLRVQPELCLGVYQWTLAASATREADYLSGPYARARLAVGYRLSPELTIAGHAGYLYDVADWAFSPHFQGIEVGIGVSYAIGLGKVSDEVIVDFAQDEPIFPVLYPGYAERRIGVITVTNSEKTEIRDVKVSFRAGQYTSAEISCGSAAVLGQGKSLEVPMFANLTDALLNFTEDGDIPGEIVVTYSLLGSARRLLKTQPIQVHNRNSLRWTETAVLAALASPNSPEILSYSKFVVGLARVRLRTGLNREMQFAMFLYEGLRLSGVVCAPDPSTPYASFHLDPEKVDYVQFPFQTLAYRSGDCDDAGVLFAACLESVGVKAAFIPLENDFLVAVSLGIKTGEADKFFASPDAYLAIGDQAWIPLSMASLREGFVNAWYAAMEALAALPKEAGGPEIVSLADAWSAYPAIGVAASGANFQKPEEAQLARSAENDVIRYISAELGPKIQDAQAKIAQNPKDPALHNQLGILYVRAGMYDEAKAEYSTSAAMNSVTALINLGNIATLSRDYATASNYYSKALALAPDNQTAKTALEKARAELGK